MVPYSLAEPNTCLMARWGRSTLLLSNRLALLLVLLLFVAVLLLAVGLLLDNALLLAVRLVRLLGHLEYTSINPNGHKEG